jgi:hypothetical protein
MPKGPRTRPCRGLEEHRLIAPCDGDSDSDALLIATYGTSRASLTNQIDLECLLLRFFLCWVDVGAIYYGQFCIGEAI